MNTLSQWIHQHDYFLSGGAVLAVLALFMVICRCRIRWWIAWASGGLLFVASIVLLRTPTATYTTPDATLEGSSRQVLSFSTMDDIDEFIWSASAPVLVEIYADLGFS